MQHDKHIAGAVLGLAYGDSWGNQTEFHSHAQNMADHSEYPTSSIVTDDTQMSIYAIYAIMFEQENKPYLLMNLQENEEARNKVRVLFADSFSEWYMDPDNNRAPGRTCMDALRTYQNLKSVPFAEQMNGMEGVRTESKGCGANMRVGWLGLLPVPDEVVINLSILQSETTHGHPLALASSVMTALTVKNLHDGTITMNYFDWAINTIQRLSDELALKGTSAPGSWSTSYRVGLTQLKEFIESKQANLPAYLQSSWEEDICSFFGEGWVAEEAYLVALAAAQKYRTNQIEGLRQLVYSGGDSDSVAAIGGMFIGVRDGVQVFPNWFHNLEERYQQELDEIITYLTRVSVA